MMSGMPKVISMYWQMDMMRHRRNLLLLLFSQSIELQKIFLEQAEAGVLKFNSATAGVDITLPFGGWKASGLGPPEHGDGDFEFYTRMQAVYGLDRL